MPHGTTFQTINIRSAWQPQPPMPWCRGRFSAILVDLRSARGVPNGTRFSPTRLCRCRSEDYP